MNDDTFFQADQITPADSEVTIIDFFAEPYQDRSRVKINFRLSYFQEPPNAAISLSSIDGEEITSVDVVNITHPDNEVTLHIPKSQALQTEFQVELKLFRLVEHKALGDDKGQISLTTETLKSSTITFAIL